MLTDYCLKRHSIILPPPQKKKNRFFWGGGGKIFWIKSSIFESGQYKKFLWKLGTERTLSATFRPKSAVNPQLNFQKLTFLSILGHFKGLIFFENQSLVQNCSKITKNGFSELLWILKII